MIRRALTAVLLAGLLVGSAGAPASAHASLVSTDPAEGAVVPEAPDVVTFTFDEPVSLADDSIQAYDAAGEPVDVDASARGRGRHRRPARRPRRRDLRRRLAGRLLRRPPDRRLADVPRRRAERDRRHRLATAPATDDSAMRDVASVVQALSVPRAAGRRRPHPLPVLDLAWPPAARRRTTTPAAGSSADRRSPRSSSPRSRSSCPAPTSAGPASAGCSRRRRSTRQLIGGRPHRPRPAGDRSRPGRRSWRAGRRRRWRATSAPRSRSGRRRWSATPAPTSRCRCSSSPTPCT